MKKITIRIAALLFMLSGATAISQTYDGPESAEYDYANSRWLIGNTGSNKILARDTNGQLSVFINDVGAGPYGIEIVGNVLYCCSGSSVKGYNLSDGANVFNVAVGGNAFLNGLAHDNSGDLYATDFSGKKIFKIVVATQTSSAVATGLIQSPNGIVFDQANNRCVFVNWGTNAPIKAMDVTTFAVSTIATTTLNSCDGITRDGNGDYYISAWGSQSVYRYNSQFTGQPEVIATNLSDPADIFYNTADNILAIPSSGDDTVDFLSVTLGTSSFTDRFRSVKIFPNPVVANSVIGFELAEPMEVSAQIFDIQSRSVHTIKFTEGAIQSGQVAIGEAGLRPGAYFIVLKADSYLKTIPVVVK
jgi:hypothetical protein